MAQIYLIYGTYGLFYSWPAWCCLDNEFIIHRESVDLWGLAPHHCYWTGDKKEKLGRRWMWSKPINTAPLPRLSLFLHPPEATTRMQRWVINHSPGGKHCLVRCEMKNVKNCIVTSEEETYRSLSPTCMRRCNQLLRGLGETRTQKCVCVGVSLAI